MYQIEEKEALLTKATEESKGKYWVFRVSKTKNQKQEQQ